MNAIARACYLSAALIAAADLAWAGPPFRTDDPEPVDLDHWEIDVFSTATHVHGDTSGVLPGIEVNYGLLKNLQLHVVAPLAFDKPQGVGTRWGYGDTELGAKYRFLDPEEDDWWPQVAIFPLVELPTGNSHRGLGTGRTHAFIPLWLQKDFDPWTTYGGGGYWINPGAGNKNFWFVGWLLQRKVTEELTLGGEIFHQTANVVGGKDSTGFNLGGSYDFSENYHLLFSAGRGIQHASTTNQFSYYLGLQLTF